MSNPQRGETTLKVGDRSYTFVLDMDGICKAEAFLSTPGNIVTITEIFYGSVIQSQRHARALIWASLQRHHPDMTIEKVNALIAEAGGSEDLANAIVELKKSTEPDEADKPAERPQAARPVTGTGGPVTSLPDASALAATSSGG